MLKNGRDVLFHGFITVVVVLLLSATCIAASQLENLYVVTDRAALRTAPSGQAKVVAERTRGDRLTRVRSMGAWVLVRQHDGPDAWTYQGNLATEPPAPLIADIFAPPQHSFILAEAAETDRSTRSTAGVNPVGLRGLSEALDMPLSPDMLEEFLRDGGIGEFAQVQGHGFGAMAVIPRHNYASTAFPAAPQTALDVENERTFGLNMAARLMQDVGKPAFGMQLKRYVNLVCLAVGRYAPGQPYAFRAVVLDAPQPLCLGLPGGIIVLTTGLMNILDNEAQLALVLARQMAHVSLGHEWARTRKAGFFRDGGTMDQAGVNSPLFRMALDAAMNRVLHSPGIVVEEQDNDAAALFMAYRAGYDPQQLTAVLRRLDGAAEPHQIALTKRQAAIEMQLFRLPLHEGMALATQRFQASR